MSTSPIEQVASLRIGTVEYVSPDEIKVGLDLEAPEGIAANAGTPRSFPRINSYVLIATEAGHIVGQVEWIDVERSPFPKRKGFQDYGLIDLPFPLRKMRVNPLGILLSKSESDFKFERGVQAFPSVGEPVLIPTDRQLRAIIESGQNGRVKIGTSPLAANANVNIDPDRLFGRHLAVLGNTGSGKSCSVAGLIQWSLEAAKRKNNQPNARFIILDPNGEYTKVFKDTGRIFQVNAPTNPLKVPLWFWNSVEICSFTYASERAQKPLLKRALRDIRTGGAQPAIDPDFDLRRKMTSILISLRSQVRSGNNYEGWKFGPKLAAFIQDFDAYAGQFQNRSQQILDIKNCGAAVMSAPNQSYSKKDGSTGYNDFPANKVDELIQKIENFLSSIGGMVFPQGLNEDLPIKFDSTLFADHLEVLANQESNPQFFDYLVMRIRTMLADTNMKSVIESVDDITLDKWLEEYVGKNKAENGCITVVDLSLVPSEIVHIVTAVISRIIFEALQRYRRLNEKSLPTVLVMEEAHTFIKKYNEAAENQSSASICCQVFEKIAREGRKFGLGLVLSSQRPSELSSTVLSQCNTFLLHRISNDSDQKLVNHLVPDNLRGLLRELPSLPSQNAILLGWASELPVMVRMNDLPESQRPQSDDPDYWDVWTGRNSKEESVQRDVDWKKITDDWQQVS